jgi:hypothetical protein
MSDFFDSDIVQHELERINKLQEDVYMNALNFPIMSRESKIEHINKLETLIEKQKIMYTRLSLSDDPMALEIKENIKKSISTMGISQDTDPYSLFDSMNKTIDSLKKHIDN